MIDVRLFRQLWSFLAVAEEGHFGRAAKLLGISQPPLTQQIQTLERSLGVRLFDRSRRGAALTREGTAILPAVQRFAEQLGYLETQVRGAKEGKTRFVKVGAITSTFYEVLPKVLRTLQDEQPNVTSSFVEIHSYDALNLIRSGEIDVAFSRLSRSEGSIQVVPFAMSDLVVAVPAGHPLASADQVPIEALADEPLVQVRRRLCPPLFDRFISACSEAGFSPWIAYEVNSDASQLAFVSCGLGIAVVPGNAVQVSTPSVVLRPFTNPIEVVTFSIAWDRQHVRPAAAAFIDIALRFKTT